jgi:Mg2+ and Co2+ transporter CorA
MKHTLKVKRKGGEIILSLREIRRRIETIEKAISERQRMLNHAEQSEDPDQIVKIPLLKNEIQLLENEKVKLVEQINQLQTEYEKKLPDAERKYFESISKQKTLLKSIVETSQKLLSKIAELQDSIKEAHMNFVSYQVVCSELSITPKNLHLQDCYSLWQARRWLEQFLDWIRKTRWMD